MPPNPYDNPELYNLKLNDVLSPGKCTLSGHSYVIEWDVQKGAALKGATLALKGIPLRTFTATFELFEPEDIAAWPEYEKILYSSVPASGDPVALRVEHPDLASRRITAVVLAELGGVEHGDDGRQKIVVKFQQYGPPKKKSGSPGSTSKSGTNPKKVDPNAAAKAELEALLAEYKKSPWSAPSSPLAGGAGGAAGGIGG